MKFLKIYLFFSCAVLFLTGCAVGPLTSYETARTIDRGEHELTAGYGTEGYTLKWTVGVFEKLNFGFQVETWSLGVRGKYAFLNEEHGWSLAAALGAGTSFTGTHYYGDLMASYRGERLEPYFTLRIVRIKTDLEEYRKKDLGLFNIILTDDTFEYGQIILGSRIHINPNWWAAVEGGFLFPLGDVGVHGGIGGIAFG